MASEHKNHYIFHPIIHFILAPAVFFAMLARSSNNPLTYLIGLGGVLLCIGLYTVAGTALLFFITLSGLHMIGMILFEWTS